MESKKDLIAYFSAEAVKKADKGFVSEKIRRFVREYYSEYHISPVSVYALYMAFCQINEIKVKDPYFRGIIEKAWVTSVNENGLQLVHLDRQKKIRTRKRKV